MAGETLKQIVGGAIELLSDNKDNKTEKLGGIFNKIKELFSDQKETVQKATEAKEEAKEQRGSFFEEIAKSAFTRQFPRLAAITDIGKQIFGKKSAEIVPWQNEFESITAFLLLIPGEWKHYITDIFAKSKIFRTLIEKWPGLDGMNIPLIGQYLPSALGKSDIRKQALNGEPQAVIAALRIMHQDIFVTGKVSFDKVKELLI